MLLAISAGENADINQMEFIPTGLLMELNMFRTRKFACQDSAAMVADTLQKNLHFGHCKINANCEDKFPNHEKPPETKG